MNTQHFLQCYADGETTSTPNAYATPTQKPIRKKMHMDDKYAIFESLRNGRNLYKQHVTDRILEYHDYSKGTTFKYTYVLTGI